MTIESTRRVTITLSLSVWLVTQTLFTLVSYVGADTQADRDPPLENHKWL